MGNIFGLHQFVVEHIDDVTNLAKSASRWVGSKMSEARTRRSMVEAIEEADTVPQVVEALSTPGIITHSNGAVEVAARVDQVAAIPDVEAAKSAAHALASSVLIPREQEIVQETLRERLGPILHEIGASNVAERGAQLTADLEGGSMVLEPVSESDGSVRLNVSADIEDGGCHETMRQLHETLRRHGVVTSVPKVLPKAPPEQQRLRAQRLRRRNQNRH